MLSTLPGAMSLPEKLIKSAKAGNSREVRKLLGRGVQITKDKVNTPNDTRFITEKFSSILILIYYLDETTIDGPMTIIIVVIYNLSSFHSTPNSVRKYSTARGCVERSQRYREGTVECFLLRRRHQQQWIHSTALGQPERPRKSSQNSAEVES